MLYRIFGSRRVEKIGGILAARLGSSVLAAALGVKEKGVHGCWSIVGAARGCA
jgi:hypothetical protein